MPIRVFQVVVCLFQRVQDYSLMFNVCSQPKGNVATQNEHLKKKSLGLCGLVGRCKLFDIFVLPDQVVWPKNEFAHDLAQ